MPVVCDRWSLVYYCWPIHRVTATVTITNSVFIDHESDDPKITHKRPKM